MHEFDITYGDSWSAFVRISALYDYDIMKDDTFRTPQEKLKMILDMNSVY